MDKKELQHKLNQPYNSENWKEVVKFVFPNVSIFATPRDIPIKEADIEVVERFLQIGTVQLNDGKILVLFELHLKDKVNLLKNRVRLNDIVSSTVNMDSSHGVLSVFEKGTDDFRFTFSAKASEFDEEEGDFKIERTDTKRFTYLLGKNESCKTPAERFYALSEQKEKANLKAVEDAFSVEKLSKRFFNDYKKQYEAFVTYLIKTPGYYTTVFNNDDKKIRDFVKIFLGRIVFIKFVQKKGWMGVSASDEGWDNGDYRFLENSFKNFKHKDNFYSEFLNPLFFEALDKGDRPNDVFEFTGTKVPYLSGGLFDIHNSMTRTINFPKEYFESLFEFLDRYNFTIDENDVNDQEVGIDPEMLGHIFENLLEDNKDKGAFYTPKEIVRYMCRESLKEYLRTNLEEKNLWPKNREKSEKLEEGLDAFINKREAGGIIDFEGAIAQALKTVKICDPAIGSGAFPMGLLQEIFHLVHLLYAASPDKVGEIWELDTWRPNVVKQNIIQNSIYGVDIEKGAVDIARLRFWLSLIVDEPEPTALPHLDYKIVVGNSLLSKFQDTLIEIDWEIKNLGSGFFGSKLAEERVEILKEIAAKQKQAFDPKSDDEKLSHEIKDLKIDLLIKELEVMIEKQNIPKEPKAIDYKNKSKSLLIKDQKRYFETLGWKNQIQNLIKLRQDSKATLEFFEWKLDFPEVMNDKNSKEVGFDIVIGNPPYVDSETMVKEQPEDREHIKNKYESASGNWDLFIPFIEKGKLLCNRKGVFSYIIPNKLLGAKYSLTLRTILAEQEILEIRDYSSVNVFKEADVYPITLLFKVSQNHKDVYMTTMKDQNNIKSQHKIAHNIFYSDVLWDKYFFPNDQVEILLKISDASSLFNGELEIKSAATVSEAYKIKEIIQECSSTSSQKKFINTGTIDPWKSLWGIKPTTYIKGQYIKPVVNTIDLEEINSKRAEQANIPKIIIAGMSSKIEAFIDTEGEYLAGKSTSIITGSLEKLKIAAAILNSRVASFLIFKSFHSLKMAGGYLNINRDVLKILTIPDLTKHRKEMLTLAESCITNPHKQQDIDIYLYKLYRLTYAEATTIQPDLIDEINKKEYENFLV